MNDYAQAISALGVLIGSSVVGQVFVEAGKSYLKSRKGEILSHDYTSLSTSEISALEAKDKKNGNLFSTIWPISIL